MIEFLELDALRHMMVFVYMHCDMIMMSHFDHGLEMGRIMTGRKS